MPARQAKVTTPIAAPLDLQWIAVGTVAGVAGVLAFTRGFLALKQKRLIENIPRSKVRSASIGQVELQGRAVGPYTLTAPITALPCFYYRTLVKRRHGSEKDWKVVADHAQRVLFYLEDDTGRMLVDMTGAEIKVPLEYEDEKSKEDNTGITSGLSFNLSTLKAADEAPGYAWYRIEECCIKPDDMLYVLGSVVENPGLKLEAPVDVPLPSLWALGVGKFVDAAEAAAPARVKLAPAAAPEGFDLQPAVMLAKGDPHARFLISTSSERDLQQQWAWQAVVYTWGGALLTLAGIGVICWKLGVF